MDSIRLKVEQNFISDVRKYLGNAKVTDMPLTCRMMYPNIMYEGGFVTLLPKYNMSFTQIPVNSLYPILKGEK